MCSPATRGDTRTGDQTKNDEVGDSRERKRKPRQAGLDQNTRNGAVQAGRSWFWNGCNARNARRKQGRRLEGQAGEGFVPSTPAEAE
jgi:hypothetical protein